MPGHNLNLLRTLQVLLVECHVSKAAAQLHLTQSAVSRQLAQLRELFDDALLVRQGNQLYPTPRALQLQEQLSELMTQCEQLFAPLQFAPSSWQGQVVLSSSDYVAHYILPDIIRHLSQQAPHVDVVFKLWSPDFLTGLGDSDIDLLSTTAPAIHDGLCGARIGSDKPVCVMRQGHPLATADKLTLEQFLAFGHVTVSGGGDKDGFVAEHLAQQGQQRRIQCTVPFFTSALNTVCQTDLLLVIPRHIAVNMRQYFAIHCTDLPLPTPRQQYWLQWHPRHQDDPAHHWLRERVMTIMRDSMYSVSDTGDD
ncbi:DNA-binding transcriptional LysR family regulator [Sinobacterium caligoides]|uniref:DNA-binding transcriptional LysR family regulator n=1 Tax=Sinobacterium caligoides TaxID=933926 RepID=A0A3N2DQD9_9GAMM|nr:LysR family transcriptional regulator [Sinobacterium caligoides]ROS02054.1 DNA-binding transcriptional LysR family regulator [Sinobacterium caligoides]